MIRNMKPFIALLTLSRSRNSLVILEFCFLFKGQTWLTKWGPSKNAISTYRHFISVSIPCFPVDCEFRHVYLPEQLCSFQNSLLNHSNSNIATSGISKFLLLTSKTCGRHLVHLVSGDDRASSACSPRCGTEIANTLNF